MINFFENFYLPDMLSFVVGVNRVFPHPEFVAAQTRGSNVAVIQVQFLFYLF